LPLHGKLQLNHWQEWRGWLGYSGAVLSVPLAGFSGVAMVACLPSENRETIMS
jgi:hypothetical protein